MKNNVYKRAHETSEHVSIKQTLASLLRHCGWVVLVESLCVDLTAFNPVQGIIWILEVERSEKHILLNALKAFMRGGNRLLIVTTDKLIASHACRIIATLTDDMRAKTLVVTADEVNEDFVHRVMEGMQL